MGWFRRGACLGRIWWLEKLVRLLIELASADSNLTQALRRDFDFVEDRLNAAPSTGRDIWFARFVADALRAPIRPGGSGARRCSG